MRVGRTIAGVSLIASVWLAFERGVFCAMPLVALFIWIAGARELLAVRLRHGQGPFGFAAAERAREAQWRAPTVGNAPARAWDERDEPGEARRPVVWEPAAGRDGFDEETIRALESFRGRLPRPGQDE